MSKKKTTSRATTRSSSKKKKTKKATKTSAVAVKKKPAARKKKTAAAVLKQPVTVEPVVAAAPVPTSSMERATATFHRLVEEVVDDKLAEMLPPLVALRNEMIQESDDLGRRGAETLDHVLALAGVAVYEARDGETCDPLIHLAVGETHRDDLPDGSVGEVLQSGFRSSRGKVIVPAKVRVNRS